MSKPWLEAEPFLEASIRPILDAMLARASLKEGQRVLDVGCGAGLGVLLAAERVGPAGHVTGVDVSPPMLARVRERAPANVWLIEGDAGAVDYPEEGFDAIISNLGTMFFADTGAAFAHLRRTVPVGAQFTFAAFGKPQKNPWFGIPRQAAVARFPDLPAPDPAGPGPMRFADPTLALDALRDGGWEPGVETVDLCIEPQRPAAEVARQITRMNATMMLAGVPHGAQDVAAIEADIAEAMAAFEENGMVRVPVEVHLFTGVAR